MNRAGPDDFSSKQLAQSRPSGTSAASVYAPTTAKRAFITKVIACNTTGSAAAASLFLDIDGTTYTQVTAIWYGKSVPANDSVEIDFHDGLELKSGGNLAVQTGTGSALTFTVIGRELDIL